MTFTMTSCNGTQKKAESGFYELKNFLLLSSATTILADNFISSLCDENRNIPWFWLLNITCRSTPFVFETVEASWSSEKANIGGNGRILKLVSNESDIRKLIEDHQQVQKIYSIGIFGYAFH